MSAGFLVFFACFWSALTLAFDGMIARNTWRQYESASYASTTGRVTDSRVVSHHSRKGGTSYSAEIDYHYEVGGQAFDGSRFRYNNSSAGFSSAQATVNAHPVGSEVRVFYDARDPGLAVLSPGIEGMDFLVVLFIMPFNMVMLGLWTWIGGWLRGHLLKPVAGGVRIIREGTRTRIRLPQYSALVLAMIVVGAVSFVSIFVVGFSTNMHPSIPTAIATLVVVALAGAGVYAWQWLKVHSGDDDLIIDESLGVIELPETYGRKDRVKAAMGDLESLTVVQITHRGSKGGVSYTYAPMLQMRGASGGVQKLADWSDQMRADTFVEWLRPRLGIGNAVTRTD
jgi:hypothetical protein